MPDLAGAASDAWASSATSKMVCSDSSEVLSSPRNWRFSPTASARAALEAELGVLNRYEDARRQAERRIVDAAAERERALARLRRPRLRFV